MGGSECRWEDEGSKEGNEKQLGNGDSEPDDGEEDNEVWVNEGGTGGVAGRVFKEGLALQEWMEAALGCGQSASGPDLLNIRTLPGNEEIHQSKAPGSRIDRSFQNGLSLQINSFKVAQAAAPANDVNYESLFC